MHTDQITWELPSGPYGQARAMLRTVPGAIGSHVVFLPGLMLRTLTSVSPARCHQRQQNVGYREQVAFVYFSDICNGDQVPMTPFHPTLPSLCCSEEIILFFSFFPLHQVFP